MTLWPKNKHLGDLISIIQRDGHMYDYILTDNCMCCGRNTEGMIRDIITMLSIPIKPTRKIVGDVAMVSPRWCNLLHETTSYRRADNLPECLGHVACQFDARTKTPWTKTISPEFIALLGGSVNLGDQTRKGFDNRTDISLREKFKAIASARFYFGIDSGLTHLALMTNTPVFILHTSGCKPWFFYPEDANITFVLDSELHEVLERLGIER